MGLFPGLFLRRLKFIARFYDRLRGFLAILISTAHRELARLGIESTKRVKQLLPTLDTKDITPGKIGRLRNQVREGLKQELAEIDGIVRGMMKK